VGLSIVPISSAPSAARSAEAPSPNNNAVTVTTTVYQLQRTVTEMGHTTTVTRLMT
jgi:hypothetical protein